MSSWKNDKTVCCICWVAAESAHGSSSVNYPSGTSLELVRLLQHPCRRDRHFQGRRPGLSDDSSLFLQSVSAPTNVCCMAAARSFGSHGLPRQSPAQDKACWRMLDLVLALCTFQLCCEGRLVHLVMDPIEQLRGATHVDARVAFLRSILVLN